MKLTEKQQALIERIGVFQEKTGMQPVAGRIIGLLYVSDKPELTFDEIREVLGISKSATSNALNLLQHLNRLDYITFSGDRKRYFRLKLDRWRELVLQEIDSITNFSDTLQEVVAERTKSTPEYNRNILDVADFLKYLHKELPMLLQQWEEQRK
ncbi:GbsR/MarR family transcriptional regulator [Pontibacter anaerobius]|uniref:MarR family transcriptional regulator n=1 Tax=Pontibacter anaerobius TaxID=2993940 RepID=A0ABT3RHV5_9BACT|nr:MarR family transcriptional regulator [Pontibacter anaerobius]MCX2741199.1 MarR family transcriptional regulator [Pontibacter anaerobius]